LIIISFAASCLTGFVPVKAKDATSLVKSSGVEPIPPKLNITELGSDLTRLKISSKNFGSSFITKLAFCSHPLFVSSLFKKQKWESSLLPFSNSVPMITE
jgi:hypothetical protein